MEYETKQAILEEAGLLKPVTGEILSGLANGSNLLFATAYGPIFDTDGDDYVGPNDVTVYVNGSPVTVASVTNKTITLDVAPANAAVVTCDYSFSNVSDDYLTKVREEAQAWVNDSMDAIDDVPYGTGEATVPPTVRKLTRWYAAAQLLMRDYGFNHDTVASSKDGAAKLKLAQDALDRYIAIGGASGLSDVSAAPLDVYAEPDLFSTVDSVTGLMVSQDDVFMRDLGPDEDIL